MAAQSYWRGHAIFFDYEFWRYVDTGEKVKDHPRRSCGLCGKPETEDGHDACLGALPDVTNACCGHGFDEPYVMFSNGYEYRGAMAILYFANQSAQP